MASGIASTTYSGMRLLASSRLPAGEASTEGFLALHVDERERRGRQDRYEPGYWRDRFRGHLYTVGCIARKATWAMGQANPKR